MPEATQQQEEVSIETSVGKFKARGSDILVTVFGTIVVAGMTLLGYILWEHKGHAEAQTGAFTQAVKEMTNAQKEGVVAQRVMNCLLSVEQRDRPSQIATCERIAR